MKRILLTIVFFITVLIGLSGQLDTVNRAFTLIKANHNLGLANVLYDKGSLMTYNHDLIDSLGAAFKLYYKNNGDTGFGGYPSGVVGGFNTRGKYYAGNPLFCGMPVRIRDLKYNLRIKWKTQQTNAADDDDKWWASINVIFDLGEMNSKPVLSERDYDLVIFAKSFIQDDFVDKKDDGYGPYWWFARNPDSSLKLFELFIEGKRYQYAVRYKFFNYPYGDPKYSKNNKVHVRFMPIDNNDVATYLDSPLKLFIDVSKNYIQNTPLPEKELDLALRKVANPDLWIKSISAGYEVYSGESILENVYFYTVIDNTLPVAPSGLTLDYIDTTIAFSWNKSLDDDFEYFNIYRSVNNNDFILYDSIIRGNFYVDSNYNKNLDYTYFITTIDRSFNESLPSSKLSVKSLINKNIKHDYSFLFYPNPVADVIYFSFDNNEIKTITIYNILGNKILDLINFENNKLNVSYLQKGVYFLKVNNELSRFIKL
jgi:hypothetical protein